MSELLNCWGKPVKTSDDGKVVILKHINDIGEEHKALAREICFRASGSNWNDIDETLFEAREKGDFDKHGLFTYTDIPALCEFHPATYAITIITSLYLEEFDTDYCLSDDDELLKTTEYDDLHVRPIGYYTYTSWIPIHAIGDGGGFFEYCIDARGDGFDSFDLDFYKTREELDSARNIKKAA